MRDFYNKLKFLLFGRKIILIFGEPYYKKWDWCEDTEHNTTLVISNPIPDSGGRVTKYKCRQMKADK